MLSLILIDLQTASTSKIYINKGKRQKEETKGKKKKKISARILYVGERNDQFTIISWSAIISSINSCNILSALFGTRAANTAGSSPAWNKKS